MAEAAASGATLSSWWRVRQSHCTPLRRECRARGAAEVQVETVDVGDDPAVARLVVPSLRAHGRLDAVVQSAGVAAYGRVEDVPVEVFDGVLRTNLLGSANLARHVVPVLRKQEQGHLVLIGSVIGDIATPYMAAYAVSKWGSGPSAGTWPWRTATCLASTCRWCRPAVWTRPSTTAPPTTSAYPAAHPRRDDTRTGRRAVLRVLDHPRDRRQVGLANNLMRTGFTLLPAVYDALVGRLLAVAALDRTTEIPTGPGSVLAPAHDPVLHGLRGRRPTALTAIPRSVWAVARGRAVPLSSPRS